MLKWLCTFLNYIIFPESWKCWLEKTYRSFSPNSCTFVTSTRPGHSWYCL